MQLTCAQIIAFQRFIVDFYGQHGRTFAWRHIENPYQIVVSEIMLQQTQTYRVEPKFEQFIATFPDFELLAQASLRDVLTMWQGLGYNRRAKFLHELAQKIVTEHGGYLPQSPEILQTLPGIGKATAASICAFAFNMPTVFIETNIRAVYIHSFFPTQEIVSDKELMPLIAQTVDSENPRQWYYALMDYGVFLKKLHKNPSRKSAHHVQQSRFEGSDRQIRGAIIRALVERNRLDELGLRLISNDLVRVKKIIQQLCLEGIVVQHDQWYSII